MKFVTSQLPFLELIEDGRLRKHEIPKWTIPVEHRVLKHGISIDRIVFAHKKELVVASAWNTTTQKYSWMNAGTGSPVEMPRNFAAGVRMVVRYEIDESL